jgi:cytoskeletal protein RodZ
MKVLKMHNNADEQFDQFVKNQLEQTEVDPALAQHYFDQMKLPPPSSGSEAVTAAAKSSWWRFWASMVVAGAAAVLIYQVTRPRPTEKPAAKVQAQAPDTVRQQDTIGNHTTPPVLAPSSTGTTTAAPASPMPPSAAPSPGVPLPTTVPAPAAEPATTPPPAMDDSMARPLLATEPPVTVPVVKRKDSLPKQLRPAATIPKKASDTVYIIW